MSIKVKVGGKPMAMIKTAELVTMASEKGKRANKARNELIKRSAK